MIKINGNEINTKPTSEMARIASQALEWRSEFGRGGTEIGVARARDISNRKDLSPRTISRMVSFFARHEVDKEAEGFRSGEDGFPSAGRIAWDLWGGDPGRSWAKRKKEQIEKAEMEKSFMKKVLNCKFKVEKTFVDEDLNLGIVEGYASTFNNEDRERDVIERGAFSESIEKFRREGKKNLPMLWMHDMRNLIGGFAVESLMEDERGLRVKGEINLDTTLGKEAYSNLKKGFLSDFSIGFMPIDFERRETGGNIMKKVDLLEISLVTIPANPMANVTSVKSQNFDDIEIKLNSEREPDTRACFDRQKAIENIEKHGGDDKFFVLDGVPVVDLVGDSMKIIPKAVFQAAASLQADRGHLTEDQKQKAEKEIGDLYDRMEMVNPFVSGFGLREIKASSVQTIRKMLQNGTKFTRSAADHLAASVFFGSDKEKSRTENQDQRDLDHDTSSRESDEISALMGQFRHFLRGKND